MKPILLIGVILTSLFAGAQTSRYQVVVNPAKEVRVEGQFTLFNDTIYIFARGNTLQLPDGEAGFVKNLLVKDNKGVVIPNKYVGEGNWVLSNVQPGQAVTIHYELLTTHKDFNWDHVGGVDEAAFTNEDGLFFTGYTLFILPDVGMKQVEVEFQLPPGWKASTPWQRLRGNIFSVESGRFLVNNCLMLGKHAESVVKVNGMEMRLAMANKLSYAKPLVERIIQRLIPAYEKMFGGIPAPVYLVAMSDERMTDGSAFRRSFSQIFKGTLDEKGIKTWGYIMGHEILHLWNGHSILPAGQEEWFKEGFTDYVANMMMRRAGLIDDETMRRKLEHMVRRYWFDRIWQRDTVSIRETGDNKEQLRFGVYGGGAVIALLLEVEMRKATDNQKGIYDLMGSMFRNYGKAGKSYTIHNIINEVNVLTGKDLQSFFDRFVTGKEYLEPGPWLADMGLDLHTAIDEVYVSPIKNATAKQKEMYQKIFVK